MTKFTNFFKVIACFTCLTVQMNMVSAQTWPPFGMVGDGLSEATAWEITTTAQLIYLATYVNSGHGALTAGKYYKLMNNIDYKDNPVGISKTGWAPIGNEVASGAIFQGNFDGNGKEVFNIWIDRSTTSCVGLFGYVSSAHIHNLGVEAYQKIIGYQYVGGLIGRADNSTIENCYAIGNIAGNFVVGGLVGFNFSSIISYSYAICEINGSNAGGLVGINEGTITTSFAAGNVTAIGNQAGGFVGTNIGSIKDCYATVDVIGTSSYMGGFAGHSRVGIIAYCYATGDITAIGGDYIGGLMGVNEGTLINCVAANNSIVSGAFNVDRVAGANASTLSNNYAYAGMAITPNGSGDSGTSATMTTLKSFNFYNTGSNWYNNIPWSIDMVDNPTKSWKICNGETLPFLQWEGIGCDTIPPTDPCNEPHAGTVDDPFLICTVQDLVNFVNYVNSGNTTNDRYWKMMNDLDLIGINNWNPIGNASYYFQGHFDGNGKVISNLTINRLTTGIGLFGRISNAEIKNLGIEECHISGNEAVGTLIGIVSGTSAIENCYITEGIISGYRIMGGLIGVVEYYSNLTINNCFATGSVIGTGDVVGGLIGGLYLVTISNEYCYAICEVSGTSSVGGLVGGGNGDGIIEKSFACGNVQGNNNVGGLVGVLPSLSSINITNCYVTGNVTGTGGSCANIGGLIGNTEYSNIINNCYATGDISGIGGIYIGGLVGYHRGIIRNCVAANSSLSGSNSVNRIIGDYNIGVFSNNYAYDGMLVNGVTVSGTHNNVNGESKPMSILMSYNFYNTGSNWYSNIPWNIAAVESSAHIWGICDGETLPFLQWEGFSCGKSMSPSKNNAEEYIIEQHSNSAFSIYPNPTSNNITISSEKDFYSIAIVDLLGRVVYAQSNNGTHTTLDVSHYSNGVYFVRIMTKNGVEVQKFVKR